MGRLAWWVAGAFVAGSLFAIWLLRPGSLDRKALKASPALRLIRWNRSLWLRSFAAIAGWPHVIDLAFGTRRAPAGATAGEVVWRDGIATLTRYPPRARTCPEPVLLVHALVTRPWILDLTPAQSLVRALTDAGHDVFLLDWGDPGRRESMRGFSDYAQTLMLAEQEVLAISFARRLNLVGYCMGATLCLARLAAWPHEFVASFAAIAAPVDLAVPGGMQAVMTSRLLKPAWLLDGSGCIPASVVRESFHLINPKALQSVRRGLQARHNPDTRATYGALARWVWEQRRLPGALFYDIVAMFRTNALFEGDLEIAGRRADLTTVRTRVLLALAERDHIVPGSSSHALRNVLDAEVLSCPSGHVSMLSGRGARDVLIPGLLAWLGRREGESEQPEVDSGKTRKKAPPSAKPKRARVARGTVSR